MSESTQPAAPATGVVTSLRAAAEAVFQARRSHALSKLQRDRSYQRWEEDNKAVSAAVVETSKAVADAEVALRALAEARFKETDDKKPGPGVSIRMEKELEYDERVALTWAINTGTALKLDVKAFEAIARAAAVPLFPTLTVRTVPKVTIATDLGKALAESPSEGAPQQ